MKQILIFLSVVFFSAVVLGAAASAHAQTTPSVPARPVQDKEFPTLLPEGYVIREHDVRLVRHPKQNRWFVTFTPEQAGIDLTPEQEAALLQPNNEDPFSRPIEVLKNDWLEKMVRFSGNQTDLSTAFRVSGELTVYRDRNYILPTYAAAVSLFGADAQAAPMDEDESEQTADLDDILLLVEQEHRRVKRGTEEVVEVEETELHRRLREALLKIPRTVPLTHIESGSEDGDESGNGEEQSNGRILRGAGSIAIWKDGHVIVDRVGRLAWDPDEKRWLFAFEADAASLAEPPVIVHPSRLLEVMEHAQSLSIGQIKFRVSGQISRYQGSNYILLRKVLMVEESSNFVK